MTKGIHDNYLILNLTKQTELLDGLSTENKKRIGKWLDTIEVKENVDGEPYITSPFWAIYFYIKIYHMLLYINGVLLILKK